MLGTMFQEPSYPAVVVAIDAVVICCDTSKQTPL